MACIHANHADGINFYTLGHAAVLFTSYKAMDMGWKRIMVRHLQLPLLCLDESGVREIENFNQSGNGVLFAADARKTGSRPDHMAGNRHIPYRVA
ncbi:MAG: hypothetical protein LBK41_05240 [Clostridiales bacterium]|jgi:hypothetical protein|nr:hypothetical protein [Clostridiales bacterium]